MHKKKKTTKILDGLLGLSILALLGFGAWYLYDSNTSNNQVSIGELIATNTPVPKQPGVNSVDNDEQAQAAGTRVSSGQDAYSLEVPNGWEVTRDTSSDLMIVGWPSDISEAPASVIDIASLGTDVVLPVTIQISASGPDDTSEMQTSDFIAGDLAGKKYSKIQASSEDQEADAPEEVVSSSYYFELEDSFIQVSYRPTQDTVESSEQDMLDEIEAMIRSLEL